MDATERQAEFAELTRKIDDIIVRLDNINECPLGKVLTVARETSNELSHIQYRLKLQLPLRQAVK